MSEIAKLRAEHRKAEKHAQRLMADKDRLRDQLRKATDNAAALQKQLNDAEAAQALVKRFPDPQQRAEFAASHGLELPGV